MIACVKDVHFLFHNLHILSCFVKAHLKSLISFLNFIFFNYMYVYYVVGR